MPDFFLNISKSRMLYMENIFCFSKKKRDNPEYCIYKLSVLYIFHKASLAAQLQ